MATLPLEIIDNIFLANPNKIISTYLAFLKDNHDKRRKITDSNKNDITENNYTIKYLSNEDTYMKYYQQSSWLKYFHSQVSNTNTLNTITKKHNKI